MGAEPSGSNPLLPRRPARRLAWLWVAFGLMAGAAACAVFRLYETVRRELEAQGAAAVLEQQARFAERVREMTEGSRLATIRALAALHVEGLTYALRRWDEANAAVVGTFQWDEAKGFLPESEFPRGVRPDGLPPLWQEFRTWRAAHPAAVTAESGERGEYRVAQWRTLDNPAFPAGALGYQAENLEMLSYAGRPVDPWAGWAGPRAAAGPWIFWYQPGPGAPVRGCFWNPAALIADLRGELADVRLVRLQLVPAGSRGATSVALDDALPGLALTAEPGELLVQKQAEARLAGLVAVALLGLFVLGALALARYSQREIREAELKATFVTQVSHELRTPLTSIRMFADMLAEPGLSEEKRTRFAGTIGRESERLGGLIERLLTFNALAQGGRPAAIATVDVTALARETLEEMEASLGAAGVRLEATLPPTPVRAESDLTAVKQALLNLLDNARKYASAGGVVRVTLVEDGGEVRLRVADEGPGIPRELGARVFEPFVQGGRTLTDKSPGVGLGLSIARGLLRQAGGDLVLLASGKGAVFEIRLRATPS